MEKVKKTILFTGGGSAGHVTPNLALIQEFKESGWQVIYVGSTEGIEKNIIERVQIPYYGIATGRLRRYFSWRTFLEPFRIIQGILQSYFLCRRLQPQIIFSKGGFVAFPLVVGAWLNRIPVVIHESDLTPGLANRLSFPFAKKIFLTFPEGKKFLNSDKVVITGTPIRDELIKGDSEKGKAFCGFSGDKPILLVIGGGLGSSLINETIYKLLPTLTQTFRIIHICGKGKVNTSFQHSTDYKQFEYVNEELADLFACADLVVSRAGANSLYELLALKKPHILIPLSKKASRGDQIVNAKYFADKGLSLVMYEEQLTPEALFSLILKVNSEKKLLQERMQNLNLPDSKQLIYQQLTDLVLQSIDAKA